MTTSVAIPPTMRAVVCHGPSDYRLETVPVPVPGAGEVLLRVLAVGVCASDLKCFHGAPKFWGDEHRPAWVQPPITPGHEFVGQVVALDDTARGAFGVDVGDHVVVEQIVPCEECRYCLRGQYWMCSVHDIFGFRQATPGAMAEYLVVPPRARVHRVSAAVPPAHAAFAEPLACSLHAVERAGVSPDDVVVVAGCGPIGLGMIAGVRSLGVTAVVALDLSDAKLEVALQCGATHVLNVGVDDVDQVIRELTDGYGADVYIDGTGHPGGVTQGLDLLRKLGTFVEYSVFGADVTVDWSIISDDKELDVRGAHLGPHCWPAAIAMIESGALPLDAICTHQLPLEDFMTALELVSAGDESIKVTLVP